MGVPAGLREIIIPTITGVVQVIMPLILWAGTIGTHRARPVLTVQPIRTIPVIPPHQLCTQWKATVRGHVMRIIISQALRVWRVPAYHTLIVAANHAQLQTGQVHVQKHVHVIAVQVVQVLRHHLRVRGRHRAMHTHMVHVMLFRVIRGM